MAPEPSTENYGRGMRRTRRSQRAKEADLNLTGLQDSREPSTSVDSPEPPKPSAAPHKPHSIYATSLSAFSAYSGTPQDLSAASHNPHSIYSPALSTPEHHSSIAMAPPNNTAEQRDSDRVIPILSHESDVPSLQSDNLTQQVVTSIEAQGSKTSAQQSNDAVASAAEAAATYMQPQCSMQLQQTASHPPVNERTSEYRPRKNADSVQPATKTERVTKPQKSRKSKKTKNTRTTAEASSRRRRPATPENNIQHFMTKDQLLQPAKLQVYNWDHPIPKDFLNLPEDLKAAKARVDAAEGENDLDPELDDWHEFCGLESSLFPNLPLKSSIGLNFVSRAKRAYRAGRPWMSFEVEELAIDSRAGARALRDPRERDIALSSSLSNTLRLYVFEQLKVRLCHEIWLQPYPDGADAASMRDSAIGTAVPTPAASDKTALEVAVQRLASLPDRLRTMVPGTALPVRTQPELPGRDRELHQPEGPPIRATQANMRGLGFSLRDRQAGLHLDMETSDEEE